MTRYLGLAGTVSPSASLLAFHPFTSTSGDTVSVDGASGDFLRLWAVPSSWNGGAAGRVDALLRGTLSGAGHGNSDAVAEQSVSAVLPPVAEDLNYSVGRLSGDGIWTYGWDNTGRLKTMTCRSAALPAANVTAETLGFIYDADWRRTKKTVTQTLTNGKLDVAESKLLWAGSLPVLEVQLHNGVLIRKRWFQWGPGLTGTTEGAGGIGGLEAIIEEWPSGRKRTLLPVQDGLGNITAVFDAATGQMVARYDYGPFGENLARERGGGCLLLPLADALVRRRERPLLLPPPLLRPAPWPLAQPRPDRRSRWIQPLRLLWQ